MFTDNGLYFMLEIHIHSFETLLNFQYEQLYIFFPVFHFLPAKVDTKNCFERFIQVLVFGSGVFMD